MAGRVRRFGARRINVSLALALVTLVVGARLLLSDQAEVEQGRVPVFAPVAHG